VTVTSLPATRNCGTLTVHRRLLTLSARYRQRRSEIQDFTARRVATIAAREPVKVDIPVVVHIVHRGGEDNISDAQVATQIDALNRDFNKQNDDIATVPPVWQSLLADTGISFHLADTAPDGSASPGITRTLTTNTDGFSDQDDDAVKDPGRGGAEAWPADRYLNIWVCTLRDLLGYAQFPGGPDATDGVAIDYRSFGTTGTVAPPFDLGRTTVHEVGHWLNLFHIWGDDGTGCTGTDEVDDTPNQSAPNVGRPTFPSVSCDNGPAGDMFMNYMDYTDDAIMVMFTAGQVARMQAALAGARKSFLSTGAAAGDGPSEEGPTPALRDVTAASGAPPAVGDPVVATVGGEQRLYYRGLDAHIHEIRLD
jgi:hypothetical protein